MSLVYLWYGESTQLGVPEGAVWNTKAPSHKVANRFKYQRLVIWHTENRIYRFIY